MRYEPSLESLRASFDHLLGDFLSTAKSTSEGASDLIAEIEGVLHAGGKRIRPLFCYWGFRAAGGTHCEEIVRMAASLEFVHTFAIVHDDIIDSSPRRRGIPTVHARRGVGEALLVGDLALVLANELFLTSGFDADATSRAFHAYSKMLQEVISGQQAELRLAGRVDVTLEEARNVARVKSGRYSVRDPLVIGARAGPDEAEEPLTAFGDLVGEAFQLRDDILGTFGDEEMVGKPVDSDIREGKRNVLFASAIARLKGLDRDSFARAWDRGTALSDEDVGRLRAAIVSSGALDDVEKLIGSLADDAGRMLEAAPIDSHARSALEDLMQEAISRET